MFSTSSSGVPAGTCVVMPTMYSMAGHPPVTVRSSQATLATPRMFRGISSHGEDVGRAAGDEHGVAGAGCSDGQDHGWFEDVGREKHLVAKADTVNVGTEVGD